MSMIPAAGSLESGLLTLPGFFSVKFSHALFLSVFQSEIVTRFFFTRNELFDGLISFSRYVLTRLRNERVDEIRRKQARDSDLGRAPWEKR